MERFNIQTVVESFQDHKELPADEQSLLVTAREASSRAYAPYSQFHVGAALILDDGTVITGSNQENVAYPSGLCAERVAFFAAGSQYPEKKIRKVAITANSRRFKVDHPISPCGACRQSMMEYEVNQGEVITILLQGAEGIVYRIHGLHQLLPLLFHEDGLKK